MRLFAAVELPADARRAIADAVARGREGLPPAAWVRPENLHLTLAFLGEVEPEHAAAAGEALAAGLAGQAALTARTAGTGAFPERGAIRVLWLALEPADSLLALAARVRDGFAAAGLPFDRKPFRSHVTLARARSPWPATLRSRVAQLAAPALAIDVRELVLFESRLEAGGARYTARARVPLAEAA